MAHMDSVPILRHRLGDISVEGVEYGKTNSINGVKVSFHPAGHVLGSAQIRVEHRGEVWVCSGDYKLQPDPIAEDFEPVKCHTFITESTFGMPVYKWPDTSEVVQDIERWWKKNREEGKVSLLTAYALGKAQRLLSLVDHEIGPVFVHGAIHAMNETFRSVNKLASDAKYLSPEISKGQLKGSLVVATPSAVGSTWVNKLRPFSTASASGWMMLRGSRRRRNVDMGFVISDHADWNDLNRAVSETGAERVICTHGYTDVFSRWLREQGIEAMAEKTLFEGENLDSDS